MEPEPESPAQQALARRRAEVIVQVQSGQLTATEAAHQLGISRKTYYQWEKKALAALMQALLNQSGGRPPQSSQDQEKQKLQQQVQELKNELLVQKQRAAIRSHLLGLESPKKKVPTRRANREHPAATANQDRLVAAQTLSQDRAAACDLPPVEKPPATGGEHGENSGT